MHLAQSYVDGHILPLWRTQSPANALPLAGSSALDLQRALNLDAESYYYSAAYSVGEALQGLSSGRYTWPTVKLYYASFYCCRAMLALNGVCIFYRGRTPYKLTCRAGELPRKAKDATHKIALDAFASSNFAPTLTSQQIELEEPLRWLMAKREEANYRKSKFVEPSVPQHFEWVRRAGVRRAFAAYVADANLLYAFDPDHAALAYPVELLRETTRQLRLNHKTPCLARKDERALRALFSDRQGPLSSAEAFTTV